MLRFQSLALASSLAFAPMGFAAERHDHQGNAGQTSAQKVIYREGGSILHDRMMDEVKRQQEFIRDEGRLQHRRQQPHAPTGRASGDRGPCRKWQSPMGSAARRTCRLRSIMSRRINVEITLSRFLDYFPGYMYVLTENVEKVRGEGNDQQGGA